MADFTALKTAIQNAIKQNGNEEITGNLLQDVLLAIVTTLGDGSINDLVTALGSEATTRGNADATLQQNINAEAQARQLAVSTLQGGINTVSAAITAINNAIGNGCVYAGIATPSSTPASGKVFYLALTAGTYTNYGGLEVSQGINILKNNGSTWSLDSFLGIDDAPTPSSNKLVKSDGVFNDIMTNGSAFDLTAYNNGTTYADLNAALTALNALPAAYKKGGMSMKYVQTSDNKYVQYFLTKDEWSLSEADWQKMNLEEEVSQLGQKIGDNDDEYGISVTDVKTDVLNGYTDDGNAGHRITRVGEDQNLGTSSGYYKTNPYSLLKGDKITLVTNSGTTDTAVVATVSSGVYSAKVIGVGNSVTTYEYTAVADCDIVVSFYKNFTSATLTRGKTIVSVLDEIRPSSGKIVYASEYGMDNLHDCADALEAALDVIKNRGILIIDRDITIARQVTAGGLFYCKVIGIQPGIKITGTFSASSNTEPSLLNLKCNGVEFKNLHFSYNVVSTTYKTRLVTIVPKDNNESDLDVSFNDCTFEAFPSVPLSGAKAIVAVGRGLQLNNCFLLGQSNNGEAWVTITPRWNSSTAPFQDKADNCRAIEIKNCRIHNGKLGPILQLLADNSTPDVTFWGVVIANNYIDSINFIIDSSAKVRDLQIVNNVFLFPNSYPLYNGLPALARIVSVDGLLLSGNIFGALADYSISSVYSILLAPKPAFSVLKNIVITNNIFDGERNNTLIRCTEEVTGMGVAGIIISNNTFKSKCFGDSEDTYEGMINWSNCNWLNVAIIGNSYQGESEVYAIKGISTPDGESWRCENVAIKGNVNILNDIDYTPGENLTVINLDN